MDKKSSVFASTHPLLNPLGFCILFIGYSQKRAGRQSPTCSFFAQTGETRTSVYGFEAIAAKCRRSRQVNGTAAEMSLPCPPNKRRRLYGVQVRFVAYMGNFYSFSPICSFLYAVGDIPMCFVNNLLKYSGSLKPVAYAVSVIL